MERRDFEAEVHNWLVHEKGYPRPSVQPEAIVAPRRTSTPLRADFAVVDLNRSEFVAIIEVKASRDHAALRNAVAQLISFREHLGKPFIPLFLFFKPLSGSGVPFEISQVLPDGTQKQVALDDFPAYQALVSGDRSGVKATRRVAARAAVDAFAVVCIGLAITASVVLWLDVSGTLELSPKQLILASVAAGFLVLPFAAKLNLLGVEFERHSPGRRGGNT
jgi:hypothetical protein